MLEDLTCYLDSCWVTSHDTGGLGSRSENLIPPPEFFPSSITLFYYGRLLILKPSQVALKFSVENGVF